MTPTGRTNRTFPRLNWFFIFVVGWLFLLVYEFSEYRRQIEQVPYSDFLTYVREGKVQKVIIEGDKIDGSLKTAPPGKPKEFVTQRTDDPQLVQRLMDANVPFGAVRESTLFRDILSWTIPALILVAIWFFAISRMGNMQRGQGPGGFFPNSRSRARIYVEKDLKVRFEDVAGVDEAKDELKEVVNFLRDPKRYSKLGGRMPKGVLLVGAPGTGKTLMARAVAGEAGVPFFSINGSEFVELFVGLGAARVRDLFEQARHHSPCIVFIDELDALGKARGVSSVTGASNDEKEQTLNQLLAELDGFDPSIGIVLIAATNRPEVLDPALLRAGRFDRQVVVDKPDRKGREQILAVHMKKVKASSDVGPDLLASLTAGFSGADLANLVNEGALIATRRGAEQVELQDFREAIERTVAGLERKSRLLNPAEKRRVAFHEMGHATVGLALGEGDAIHKISIIPRGVAALGYTFHRPIEDRYLMSKHELESKLAMMMGGRAAEMIFFDEISTGAADDLEKATEICRAMITRYGMSSGLGLPTLERESAPMLGGHMPVRSYAYSETTAEAVDLEIRRMLNRALTVATYLLKKHRTMVEEGAQILLVKETLDEDEIRRLWEKSGDVAADQIAVASAAPPNVRSIKAAGKDAS